MDTIKEIIVTLLTVSLTAGAVQLLAPDGNGGTKKQISLIASLTVCAVLVFSLTRSLKSEDFSLHVSFPADNSFDSASIDAAYSVADTAGEILCRELRDEISSRYQISNADIKVELDKTDLSSVKILSVTLYGDGDLMSAGKYISSVLGDNIEVRYDDSDGCETEEICYQN